jgi:stage V sporulation protein S
VETLKVSSTSNPNSVAGALAGAVRRHHVATVTVVGAGALNQSIKAVAIARNHVRDDGLDLICIPSFTEVDIDGAARTAIVLRVEHRPAIVDLRVTPEAETAPTNTTPRKVNPAT